MHIFWKTVGADPSHTRYKSNLCANVNEQDNHRLKDQKVSSCIKETLCIVQSTKRSKIIITITMITITYEWLQNMSHALNFHFFFISRKKYYLLYLEMLLKIFLESSSILKVFPIKYVTCIIAIIETYQPYFTETDIETINWYETLNW